MAAIRLALLGATDPLGEAVLNLLAERDLAIDELVALDVEASENCVQFSGRDVPVQGAVDVDFGQFDLLLCAGRTPAVGRIARLATVKGCRVIGLAEALDEGEPGTGIPAASSLALARVLVPIRKQAGLASLDVVIHAPMSMAGLAGVEELAGQTRALFALGETEAAVFPVRIAFNLIPQVGIAGDDGSTAYESAVSAQTRHLLGDNDLPVSVTAVWTPMFHGAAMVVHGVAGQALDVEQLRKWLSMTDGVTLMDTPLPGGVPTPATDAVESDDVFVGRVRVTAGQRFSLWLVMDMIRLEAARMVDEVEKLIEK